MFTASFSFTFSLVFMLHVIYSATQKTDNLQICCSFWVGPLLYEQSFTLLELVPAVGPGKTIDNNNDKVSKIERYMFQ